VSLAGTAGDPQADAIGGILAQVLGQSASEQKARIEEASKNANDLTGLVKKKPKAQPSNGITQSARGVSASNGKRKLEDDAESSEEKKVRTDG
jgi:HAT1-interacting factor 1